MTEQAEIDAQFETLASLLVQTLRSLAAAGPPPFAGPGAEEQAWVGKRHLPVLLTVTFCGSLSVSELAARLGLGLSTASSLVGELSRAGMLERSEDAADHRRTIVRVDERHRDAVTAWARDAFAPLRRTLERLTPDGRELFLDGWRILHEEAVLASERRETSA